MRKKVWKKAAAGFAVLSIAVGMISGCSPKKDEETEKQAKGRFVEREVPLPEELGTPVGMLYEDSGLTLYTYLEEIQSYQSYVYEEDTWSAPREESWLTDGLAQMGLETLGVFLGADKKVYGIAYEQKEENTRQSHVLTAKEDGAAADVTPESLRNEGLNFYDLAVLKDGTIAVGDYENSTVKFYQDGEKVFSAKGIRVSTPEQQMVCVGGNTAGIPGEDGNSIVFYDTEEFRKNHSAVLEQQLDEYKLLSDAKGIWYLVNSKGIHRIAEDGSITETIMDGGNGMMSSSTAFLHYFVTDGKENFYGLYNGTAGEWKLMQYLYDEAAAAVPEKTLTVYGLKESQTVVQAVYGFQSRHPEVKVEYNTAAGAGEEELPTADDIRTLNTELLSGQGPDILILDGLSIESYVEKGVLADLTDTAEHLSKEEGLIRAAKDAVQKDGKVFALPARINIPLIYGTQEEVTACRNLEALHTYVESREIPALFGSATAYQLAGMTLFHMMYDELLEEDGRINEDKLTQLLTDWLKICNNTEEVDYPDDIWPILDKSFCSEQNAFGNKVYANVNEILGNNFSVKEAYALARETGRLPESVKGYYVPRVIAGINASSRQQDLGKEFIAYLFTEEMQENDTFEGMPVLQSLLDEMAAYAGSPEAKDKKNINRYTMKDPDTGKEVTYEYGYPTKEEMESLLQIIKELKMPFLENQVVSDMVLQQLGDCYQGEKTPREAAQAVCRKADAYLAE